MKAGACDDAPSDGNPDYMECLACGGQNPACAECHGTGEVEIARCPSAIAGEQQAALDMIDYADAGTLPRGGGVLDQTDSFLTAREFYRAQHDHWATEVRKRRQVR